MVSVLSPLTWGIYTKPPPDIPECGFIGELCPPPTQGKSPRSSCTKGCLTLIYCNVSVLDAKTVRHCTACWDAHKPCSLHSKMISAISKLPLPNFYRAMHCSAKRGLAIACCPSVLLSVCSSLWDVGGLWSHGLEILKTNWTQPNIFALCSPKAIQLVPGEHWEILGILEVGGGKVTC